MPNNVLVIASAEWTLTGTVDDPSKLFIKGTGTGGINIPSTNAAVAGAVVSITSVTAVLNFPTTTKYYNPFTITWEVSFDGGTTWQGAGTSQNVIYVCLVTPTPTLYRTVVHLACSNEGAANADAAVTKTWALVSPHNVNGWNEATQSWTRVLYYYKPGTTFGNNPAGGASALLNNPNSTGQCSTWASLLQDAFKINGATTVYTTATAIGYPYFLVKDFTYNASTNPAPGVWNFVFGGAAQDMIPVPAGGVYGDLTNQATVAGQNSAPPSQKVFNNHQFIKYTTSGGTVTYYDASYGITYSGPANFQATAVDGFAIVGTPVGGKRRLEVVQPGAALKINFVP